MFDVREWVLISDCPIIDGSVILHWVVRPILFFDAEGTGSVWGFGWFNISLGKLFFCPLVHKLGFWGAEGIYFTLKGVGGVRFEVDSVVILPPQRQKAFCFFLRKYLPVSFIFFWETVGRKFFVCVVCLDRPFLCKMGGVYLHDEFVSLFEFSVVFERIPSDSRFDFQSFRCFLLKRMVRGRDCQMWTFYLFLRPVDLWIEFL